MIELTIYAECCSKANSRRIVGTRSGKPRSIKSDKALKLVAEIEKQVNPLKELLEGDLDIYVKIYYPSRRNDLDPSAVFDALQGRIYKNDRQIKRYTAVHALDKNEPRIYLRISSLEGNRCPSCEGHIRQESSDSE